MDYIDGCGNHRQSDCQKDAIPRLRNDIGIGCIYRQVGESIQHHLREGVVGKMYRNRAPQAVGFIVYPPHESPQAKRYQPLVQIGMEQGKDNCREQYCEPRFVAGEQAAADYAPAQQLFANRRQNGCRYEQIHRTGGIKHLFKSLFEEIRHREKVGYGFYQSPHEGSGHHRQHKHRHHALKTAATRFVYRDVSFTAPKVAA